MIIPENYFIVFDIVISLLFLAMIFVGYKRGLLYELVSILYTLGSLFFSWFIAPVLAGLYPLVDIAKIYPESSLLVDVFDLNPILNTIIYFVLVFLALKVLYFIISIILKGFNSIPVLGFLNRLLGACLGFINGLLITMVISMLFTLPLFANGQKIKDETILKYINNFTQNALNYIVENIDLSNLEKQFDNFDIDTSREALKDLLTKQHE